MGLYLGKEKINNVASVITQNVDSSDDLPLADGTASASVSKKFSRADHRHPSDSTKLDKTDPSAIGSFIIKDLSALSGIQLVPGQAQRIIFGSPGPTIFTKADAIINPKLQGNIGAILPITDSEGNFVPIVQIDRIKEPTTDTMPTTKKYVDDLSPKARKITLTTSGWSNNQQSVTCTGVSASATSQEIRVMPADASKTSAYVSCGISCVAQASNSLTFVCDKVPTTAIDVYVVMQSLNFQS